MYYVLDINDVILKPITHPVMESSSAIFECFSSTSHLVKKYQWANEKREVIAFGKIMEIKNVTRGSYSANGCYRGICYYCEIIAFMPNTDPLITVKHLFEERLFVYRKYLELLKNMVP